MNNTASLRRTEFGGLGSPAVARRMSTLVAAGLLSVMMISFKPFQTVTAVPQGGDVVNQLGFSSIGAVSLFALITLAEPRKLWALLSPSFLLLLGFLLLSVANALDPPSAMRAASFTLIGILAMATILALPRDADAFCDVLLLSGLLVLGLSYAGLVLFPYEAIHQADSVESQHAGLWRGVFTHKNIAGPVMACYSFCGLYIYRRGRRLAGALLFLAAMTFMINTGSKTTAGLVPLSMAIIVMPGLFGMRAMSSVLFALAIVGTGLATLGIVFIEPLKHLAAEVAPELTYTGRVTLWEFAGEMLAKRPWTGYGYESFWGTPVLFNSDQPFDRAWDIRPMVHGHDGYIDIAVIMGIPALIVALWAFFVAPLRDYLAIPLRKESVYIGDLFLMILLFAGLNAFLESFFFRRADPVWLFFVFGIIGLRLAARFPMPAGAPSERLSR